MKAVKGCGQKKTLPMIMQIFTIILRSIKKLWLNLNQNLLLIFVNQILSHYCEAITPENCIKSKTIEGWELERLSFITTKFPVEDIFEQVQEDRLKILKDLSIQLNNLRGNSFLSDSSDLCMVAYNMGKCFQNFSIDDLNIFKTIVNNNEVFLLLTLEPLLITKIGLTVIIRNWVYFHTPGNFVKLMDKSYKINHVIVNKPAYYNTNFVFNKHELTWSKKAVISGVGLTALFSSIYLSTYNK